MTAESFLQGTMVLDLSQYIPGPFATRMLADMGADVVKIEPVSGDRMREWGPLDGNGVSAFYDTLNLGKSVVNIDLKSEHGRRDFLELVSVADVLVESYRPGVMDRLNLSYAELRRVNSRLIYCAITGYGQYGPYKNRAGHDLNYMAATGALNLFGDGKVPSFSALPICDFASGQQAAFTVASALVRRQASGQGAYIDLSMTEVVLSWMACTIINDQRNGTYSLQGTGEDGGGLACYNVYRTADNRYVTLGALEPRFWIGFCEAVGQQKWISRQQEPVPQRGLISEVADLFAEHDLAWWNTLLSDVDTCYEPIFRFSEVSTHPQFVARSSVNATTGVDPTSVVKFPAQFDGHLPHSPAPVHHTSVAKVLEERRQSQDH